MNIDRRKAIPGILFWWMALPWWSFARGESTGGRGQGSSSGNRSGGLGPSWCCGRWFG